MGFADTAVELDGFELSVPLAIEDRSTGLEFVNRGDPVGFCEREADTGFASGKAENMIA